MFEFEESDELDNADDMEASAGPPPASPIASSSGANIVKENNNNKSKSKLQHNGKKSFQGSWASKAWDFGGLKKRQSSH